MKTFALLLVLVPSFVFANGERERIAVMADRVRWGIKSRPVTPDAPPNIRLRKFSESGQPVDDTLQQEFEALKLKFDEIVPERDSLKEELERLRNQLEELRRSQETIVPLKQPIEPVPDPQQKQKKPVASTSFQMPVLSYTQAESSSATDRYDVYVATLLKCEPCRILKRRLPDGDERAKLTYVMIGDDENGKPFGKPDEVSDAVWRAINKAASYHGMTVPFCLWLNAKGEPLYFVANGGTTMDKIVSVVEKPTNKPPGKKKLAAVGLGGAIHDNGIVAVTMDWIDQHIGDGVEMIARMDRTGPQTISLLRAGKRWPFEDLFGLSGRFAVSAKGASNLPVDELAFTYLVDGKDLLITPSAVRIRGVVPNSGVPGSSAVGEAVSDPITLSLTILSIAQTIWGILNPTADLRIGGTISATAVMQDGTLTIKFKDMPSIRFVMLFAFELGVKQVQITRENIHLDFSGSWLVKSRDFRIAAPGEAPYPSFSEIPREPDSVPRVIADVAPVAKVPAGWHSHRCDHHGTAHAGTEPSVWSHSSASFGKYPDHQCPKCGKYQFDVWKRY